MLKITTKISQQMQMLTNPTIDYTEICDYIAKVQVQFPERLSKFRFVSKQLDKLAGSQTDPLQRQLRQLGPKLTQDNRRVETVVISKRETGQLTEDR